jgi:hypothetical protein
MDPVQKNLLVAGRIQSAFVDQPCDELDRAQFLKQKPRRSGVCVLMTQLICGEAVIIYDVPQYSQAMPFVLPEATLNSRRVFSLLLQFSSAA